MRESGWDCWTPSQRGEGQQIPPDRPKAFCDECRFLRQGLAFWVVWVVGKQLDGWVCVREEGPPPKQCVTKQGVTCPGAHHPQGFFENKEFFLKNKRI